MSDAPERIWADYGVGNWTTSREKPPGSSRYITEYVRADIAKAENERLRAALVDIISVGGCYGGAAHMQKVDEIARAALAKLE